MVELLFKYPWAAFQKGRFVLAGAWPGWALAAAIAAAAALLWWHVRRHRGRMDGARSWAIWTLETALAALLLLILWRPAISVATLRPQQNVVAVLVDDSRSMAQNAAELRAALAGGLMRDLHGRFQVRMYRFGGDLARIASERELAAALPATHIAQALDEVMDQNSTLPLGAMVLLSDGADTAGGIGRETLARLRERRVPVHAVAFGPERPARDLELSSASVPARTLPESRFNAEVTLRQSGYSGRRVRLAVRDGARLLASREVVLGREGVPQTENVPVDSGAAGPKTLNISVESLPGEENAGNNTLTRVMNVSTVKPRVLYIEGEPRWEFKFIRRAVEDDHSLDLVTMLRTTQNKIYRQNLSGPHELEQGFPATPEELFAYQGLIIGSVEAGYFTPAQQELIKEFAGRRGAGVLFLGGRFSLAEGGWANSPAGEMLPVALPAARATFHREMAGQELTAAGRASLLCRLEEDPERNLERWRKMPQLANYSEAGEAKPGASVLMLTGGRPLLAIQNYGRGRAAVLATAGTWRWKMLEDHTSRAHETFWRQMLRYLAADTPGRLALSTPRAVLEDEAAVPLRAEVRSKDFRPLTDAAVEARITGPDGAAATVELRPLAGEPGVYGAEWSAPQPGSYVAEAVARRGAEEAGRDVIAFRREDGVAENFHMTRNRELLEHLAASTGGRYYAAPRAAQLAREIAYSEAGITSREIRDLWDMPAVFLLALMLRGAEWVLRRRWGAV
ncbi:MAG: hypothetical protein ACE15B_17780 [Bryobacteraceae bacterium]